MAGEIHEPDPLIEDPAEPGLSKFWKISGGIGAFLPIVGYFCLLPFLMNGITENVDPGLEDPFLELGFPSWLPMAIAVGGIWVLAVYGTMGGFIVHAIRNKRFNNEQKILWCLGLFFGNIIVYPFYWYHHLLHESSRMGLPPNRKEQIFIGVVSALPLLLVVFLFFFIVGSVMNNSHGGPPETFITVWAILFTFSFFAIWVYQMIHVFRNKELDGGMKGLWFVLIFLLGWVTMPIYWIVHILDRKGKNSPPGTSTRSEKEQSIQDYLNS